MTDHPTIHAALVAALADLTVVEKGRTADTGKYSYDYADLGDIVKATRPVLAEHGLAVLQSLEGHEGGLAVTTTIVHTGGDTLTAGPFPFPHGKDAQATGSMVTYHRRYALLAALGMATGEDDDGAAAIPRSTSPQEAQPNPATLTVSAENAQRLIDKASDAGLSVAEVVKLGTAGRTDDPHQVLLTEVRAVREALDNLTPDVGEVAP